MTFCISSASAVRNVWTTNENVIQFVDLATTDSKHFRGKLLCFSGRHRVNHTETRFPRTLAFATGSRKDKAERNSSLDALSDDITSFRCAESFAPDSNVDVSYPEPKTFFPGSIGDDQASVLDKLKALRFHILASEKWNSSQLNLCDRKYLECASNIIHYMALKSLDVEQLNNYLASLGMLSLDENNLDVLARLNATIQLLQNSLASKENAEGESWTSTDPKKLRGGKTKKLGKKEITSWNKELLLGNLCEGRSTHIMVTVGREATESETLITDLLKAGASIIRINCAHGDPSIWGEIIRRVRRSSQMLEIPCRVLMDLAGPKLRTGMLKPGPPVMKVSPKKDAYGNVVFPAQVWLSLRGTGPPAHLYPDATIYVQDKDFLAGLRLGDSVSLCDARGKKRMLRISKEFHVFSGTGFVAECGDAAYIESGTKLYVKGKKGKRSVGQVVEVPHREAFVRVKVGDLLVISRDKLLDEPSDPINGAHRITCSSSYLFDSVKPGETIAFDDGRIWGVINGTGPSEIVVSITQAGPRGTKIGSEKSINIPQSDIRFEGLTSKDIKDLDFVVSHADMVGISFIRNARDITVLKQELDKRGIPDLGIVLKIETESGFKNLPLILLEAMKCPNPLGIMIARGDLAVECGWERLANIQEEIMAVSKAARVPVIWATQVLESLVKSGVPTRAEITDVAYAKRADCVMLNKGKHIVEAVAVLDTILHSKLTDTRPELNQISLCDHLSS
ncbi:PREDICTED: plastidial pyruvate kinase 4, chloroplastic [Tarenaya hassleriana]|uniref:plastidial pyruvate kinase 4, chloroplastic n=1 Tax=Tarenaya hassleriana TaxID=28532 RepID=UPI00053C1C09|nr:PREDICTED: plastidial pyruvate kinase 4, chloroplastic [Tarenaya hassleriana]XP_010545913.1 PREDICTED: plastidial pyruvate kinase 4, chloroplastic [Tarenaya hassleriana]